MMRGLLAENGIEAAIAPSGGLRPAQPVRRGRALRAARAARTTSTRRARSSPRTSPDGSADEGVFDRMAARYDELRPADAAWWEQFELTGTAGLAASTRLLDVGCGTGRLANAAAERFGVRAWGVDRSERDGRAGARRRRAGRRLPRRLGGCAAVPGRLVRRRHDAARRAHARRRARERPARGRARARARRAHLHLDVRARALHAASTSRPTCRACRPSTSPASPSPTCSRASCARAGFDDRRAARAAAGGVDRARRGRRARARRLHLDRAPAARGRGRGRRRSARGARRRRVRPTSRRASTGGCWSHAR